MDHHSDRMCRDYKGIVSRLQVSLYVEFPEVAAFLSCYSGGYIGIMEKKMETTIV